jgi:serine/threonine protein kinase
MALEGVQLGQYRLARLLGSGGMGEVYLAEDARIGQQVAIKVSRTDAAAYPHSESARDAARLFQREAKAIARLDHPRILPLFGYGEEHVHGLTLTYIVMAYRPEGSFAQWLQQRDTAALLPVQDVIYFIKQAAEALQYAHDHQVVHQDVKPANFLLRANKEQPSRPDVLLTDFGIARLSSTTASISHSIRGTPAYMAPEQWSGEAVYATDQYALAVLAYELLAGHAPFAGRMEQVMYQHIHGPVQPPSAFNPLLPTGVDTVMLQALAKHPEERFPSIAAFAHALAQAAEGVDVSTAGPTTITSRSSDLSATLAISRAEAETGAKRTLTLPGGRRVSISIPARAYDGQILRLQGLGEPSYEGGSRGALILTLSVKETDATQLTPTSDTRDKTVPASNPGLRSELVPSSGSNHNGRMASGSGVASFASNVSEPHSSNTLRRGVSTSTAILFIGLAFLVLLASFGFFYLQSINRSSTTSNDAVATTQAQGTTSFALTATVHTNTNAAAAQVTATPTVPSSTPTPVPTATAIPLPSYSDAEVAITYYYENQSDFAGVNVIQSFNGIKYENETGTQDHPQFLACAQYKFAKVTSPTVTSDTGTHTFTFQFNNGSWAVTDMGNWNSCIL